MLSHIYHGASNAQINRQINLSIRNEPPDAMRDVAANASSGKKNVGAG